MDWNYFWLGFISAFGVALVIVLCWMKWDEWQQMKELDRQNTEALLNRVKRLEDLAGVGAPSVGRRSKMHG